MKIISVTIRTYLYIHNVICACKQTPTFDCLYTFTHSYAYIYVLPFVIDQVLNIDTFHNGNEFVFHYVDTLQYCNIALAYIFQTQLP